jgi:hypothetical protein
MLTLLAWLAFLAQAAVLLSARPARRPAPDLWVVTGRRYWARHGRATDVAA